MNIGSLSTPSQPSDCHRLLEDTSCLWAVSENLEQLISTKKRYGTYLPLVVQVAVSYVYSAIFGTSYAYPKLADCRYYKPLADKDKELRPESILNSYLSVGFGSKPLEKSTMDIGGSTSYLMFEGSILTALGILLHHIGCWTVLDKVMLPDMRDVVKAKRSELLSGAGARYTQIIELCFASSKKESREPGVQADVIYRKVVVPLQNLAEELQKKLRGIQEMWWKKKRERILCQILKRVVYVTRF
ncbi:hypothetical protein MMC21_004203 [Puttea exsequens]|nr:hypothetical protein [Puttea exsequens]